MIPPPRLSVFDPEVSVEGGVDPLSLAATYERLAERIYPFLTVRMSRIRFLTLIAAGAVVCQEFEDDDLAADGSTPPWLVYEWLVVEAFFQALGSNGDSLWGNSIPGILKVSNAVANGQRVGAPSYLKTPKIFGFTGVYRRLALGLDIIDEDYRLSEGGLELLAAWEKDQRLPGFVSGTSQSPSDGQRFRDDLRTAVRAAMRKGYTCQPRSWERWAEIVRRFQLSRPGRAESGVLWRRLTRGDLRNNPHDSEAVHMRAELLNALASEGRKVASDEEPTWFREISSDASAELRARLEAVDAYECVSLLLSQAFNLARHLSTKDRGPVTAARFSAGATVRVSTRLVKSLPSVLGRLEQAFERVGYRVYAESLLVRYGGIRTPAELFDLVMAHHVDAQKNKPPDGKRPWFDSDRGGHMVRALYRLEDAPEDIEGAFVHPYRTATASNFLADLGRVQ